MYQREEIGALRKKWRKELNALREKERWHQSAKSERQKRNRLGYIRRKAKTGEISTTDAAFLASLPENPLKTLLQSHPGLLIGKPPKSTGRPRKVNGQDGAQRTVSRERPRSNAQSSGDSFPGSTSFDRAHASSTSRSSLVPTGKVLSISRIDPNAQPSRARAVTSSLPPASFDGHYRVSALARTQQDGNTHAVSKNTPFLGDNTMLGAKMQSDASFCPA